MTIEELRKCLHRTSGKKNKYGAKRVGAHASKKEHGRAAALKIMQRANLIANLREQVPYILIPAQYAVVNGERKCVERAIKYIADFVYTDCRNGQVVVEDAKGFRTKEYIIKRKLMLYVHGIRIKEV